MLKLVAFDKAEGRGRRLVDVWKSPWLVGGGDEASYVGELARSGASWSWVVHKTGWFKRLRFLKARPAEMVLVKSFLDEAHNMLRTDALAIALPSTDTLLAARTEDAGQLMIISTLRYTEPGAQPISPDLLLCEHGKLAGMMLNTFVDEPMPALTEIKRVVRVGSNAEFHVVAGRDEESLFDAARGMVSFAVTRFAPDPTFSGECTVFLSAPEASGAKLDTLAATFEGAVENAGQADRLQFRVVHTPCEEKTLSW